MDDDDDDDDVHSARTVPPEGGGSAYSNATVVREVPAEILAAIEPPEQKLAALTVLHPPKMIREPEKRVAEEMPSVVLASEPALQRAVRPVHISSASRVEPSRLVTTGLLILLVSLAIWIWLRWL